MEQEERKTRITPEDRISLDYLDLKEGGFVGFGNQNVEPPFLIAMVGAGTLKKGTSSQDPNDFALLHFPKKEKAENWILNSNGGAIELHIPEFHSLFHPLKGTKHTNTNQAYFVEDAYAGEREIIKAVGEIPGFDTYIPWLESEFARLKTGR